MNVPNWVQQLVRVLAGILAAQAIIVAYIGRVGIPELWISAAFGIVGLLLLGLQIIVDAMLNAQGPGAVAVRALHGLIAAQAAVSNLVAPFSPSQRIIVGIFGMLSFALLVLELTTGKVATVRRAQRAALQHT